jgi:L-arabinonolactonase
VPVERDRLGEGPVWDPNLQSLYWADQLGKKIRRYTPSTGAYQEWSVPKPLGCIALTHDSALLIAMSDGFYTLDLATGVLALVAAIPQTRPGVRLNDGRCDRAGRLIAGSVVTDGGPSDGTIYRLHSSGRVEVIRKGMVIVNAICANPQGDKFFYADSREGVIYCRTFARSSDELGDEEVFADTRPHGGTPDGATVDAEGGLWVAQIMRGQILRFNADGTLDRKIPMPAPHVSSLAFGGSDLDTLYVTTVRETGMLIKTDHPLAGSLFAITGAGVRGVPEGRFERHCLV